MSTIRVERLEKPCRGLHAMSSAVHRHVDCSILFDCNATVGGPIIIHFIPLCVSTRRCAAGSTTAVQPYIRVLELNKAVSLIAGLSRRTHSLWSKRFSVDFDLRSPSAFTSGRAEKCFFTCILC